MSGRPFRKTLRRFPPSKPARPRAYESRSRHRQRARYKFVRLRPADSATHSGGDTGSVPHGRSQNLRSDDQPEVSRRGGSRSPIRPGIKKTGSFSRRFKRGRGRVGASSAARNAFHCVALRPKDRRSASASSARAKALSSTNSLTERCETAAAACRARFALRVSRRSSFSLRVVRVAIIPFHSDVNDFARQCKDNIKRVVCRVVAWNSSRENGWRVHVGNSAFCRLSPVYEWPTIHRHPLTWSSHAGSRASLARPPLVARYSRRHVALRVSGSPPQPSGPFRYHPASSPARIDLRGSTKGPAQDETEDPECASLSRQRPAAVTGLFVPKK